MSPTIRSIAGAVRTGAIEPRRTALVLVDFQNEYFNGRLPLPGAAAALTRAQALVEHADRHGIAVFHVRHVNASGASLFARGSLASQIHQALTPAAGHHVLEKSMVATFAGTPLDGMLRERGIGTLLVAGLMTHMCVSTLVREARAFGPGRDYGVLVAGDACATRDIDSWDGDGVVPSAMLHRAALTALADNFAEVLTTAALLDLPIQGE
ncbi:nicotinamidase-related amidase [Pseudoduganella lurida]|uniref:Nicotinamidase-related amidase n=1 Tax=Pseudoduganella lurida TaxID=1036180 RepID=A0A562R3N1_9BURK|nr:isochorismatase family protein [Pseudoduganella lurida]TWI63685.1 nicotinamidase-related amidase [Pseudoduganella lurida]